MNSFDQNQESQDFSAEANASESKEMSSSSINDYNLEDDQKNSESRPFCFQQLKSRSENSSARNYSRNSDENTKNHHDTHHLSTHNNLFRDNLQQPFENDYSSSNNSEQYADDNSIIDLKSMYDNTFHNLNSFILSISDQEISQDSDFDETIYIAQQIISEFLSRSSLLKEEQFIDIKIANVTGKINKIKNRDQEIKQYKEEINQIKEELNNLETKKSSLVKETNTIRSENQNLYSIPILNRPVIPTQRRSPYIREVNRIRNFQNEIERQEKMLDYQKHEMDREIAILTNHVSAKETEVLNLLDQISKAESRNIVAYVPCSIFSKTRNFNNTSNPSTNPSSSLSSTPNVYSIPNNQVKLAKPRKLAAMPSKPKEKGKSKKKTNTARISRDKAKNTTNIKRKTALPVHEPPASVSDTSPRSPRSPRSLIKNKSKVSYDSNEDSQHFNSDVDNKIISNDDTETSEINTKGELEELSEEEPHVQPVNNDKPESEEFPSFNSNNQSASKDTEEFPSFGSNNQNANNGPTEGFPSFGSNNSQATEGFPSFGSNNSQATEGFPSFRSNNQNTNNGPTEGFPSFGSNNQNTNNGPTEGFPSFGSRNQNANNGPTEGFPSFGSNNQNTNNGPTEGFPSFGSNNPQAKEGFPSFGSNNSQATEGFPSFESNNSQATEGFPSFGSRNQNTSNGPTEGFPSFNSNNSQAKEGFPSFGSNNQNANNGPTEGFPSFGSNNQNANNGSTEGFPSFGSNIQNARSAPPEGFPQLKASFPSMEPPNNQINSSKSTGKVEFPDINFTPGNNNDSNAKESKPGLHITFDKNVMARVEFKKKRAQEETAKYVKIAKNIAEEVISAAIKEQAEKGTKEEEEDEYAIYNQPPETKEEEEDEYAIYNQPPETKEEEEDEYAIYNQPPETKEEEEDEYAIYNQPPEEEEDNQIQEDHDTENNINSES